MRLYVEGLILEKQLVSPKVDSTDEWTDLYKRFYDHSSVNRSLKKRYDYNSIIVSMYGLLEQYIQSLIREYLEALQKIVPSYSKLPEQVVNNHVAASFELIKQTEQSRYRGTNTKKEIIHKLNSCLSNPDQYRLNAEAFCHHTANFRSDVIDDFFRKVGISNIMEDTLENPNFGNLLKDLGLNELRLDIEKTVDRQEKEDRVKSLKERAFTHLNDLAERRNDVAHGVPPSEVLDLDMLLDYLKYLDVFGNSIYDVLIQNLLHKEVVFFGTEIGKPTDVYKEGSVACIWSNKLQIKKDDFIVCQNANEFIAGRILGIQIDDTEVNEVSSEKNIEIGLQADCKIKITHKLFIIPHEKNIL